VDLTNQKPDELLFVDITKTEVYKALFSTSANISPSPNQINYTMIKWAWPSIQAELTALMQKCLTLGYYPQQWRTAVAVALQKPSKPDYTQPHVYRLITLLECMGKILEKIIACRLTFMIGHYELISGA